MSGQNDERLGTWFERAARAAGHAGLWRAYVSGRLGLPMADWRIERLAGSPFPRDRDESDALAASLRIESTTLWWLVEEGRRALAQDGRGQAAELQSEQGRPGRSCRVPGAGRPPVWAGGKVNRALRTIHVGVGGRGRWPVEVLGGDPRFESVGLVDLAPEPLASARERLGLSERACFATVAAALERVEADALVVCTPTRTHAAVCRAGFSAGKHVLVEKGMTLDWAEAGALVAEAEVAGVCFCVSQNYRYMVGVRTLRQAIESGRYGRPHLIDLIQHRHRPLPRTLDYPGAMVWDMACHHFDSLVHLFGPVARATAVTHGAPWSPYANDAGVTAALEFASGPVCSYLLTHQATVPDYRWTLQSELGMLRTRGESGWEWVPRGPVQQFAPGGTPEPVEPADPMRSEQGVVDDWLAWIDGGPEPGISGRHNLETLATCEMVLRSAAGRRAVERAEL